MSREKNNNTATLAIFGILATLTLLLTLSQIYVGGVLSWLALGYYIIFTWAIVKYFPAAFILLLWFIFIRLTTMLSGVAIENDGYMPEILMQGYPTGAFARLAAIYTIGILFAVTLLNMATKYLPHARRPNEKTITLWTVPALGTVILCCLGAILIGLKNGFPVFEQIDRMLYWKQVDNRFLYFFLSNRSIFGLFLGLVYSVSSGMQKKAALGTFLFTMIVSLLFAEKFASICMMIFSFITPVFLRKTEHLQTLSSKLLPVGIIIITISLPATLIAYGFKENSSSAVSRLQARATSQAQVWFIADHDQKRLAQFDSERVTHNIKAMASTDPDRYVKIPPYLGVRDFMVDYMDEDRYEHYLERGATFTLATEGYLLRIFGWLGMIPAYCFLLAIYCAFLVYLNFAIMTANPIRLLMISKILVWANYGLNQGYFYFLVGFKVAIVLAAIFFFEILVKTLNRNRHI